MTSLSVRPLPVGIAVRLPGRGSSWDEVLGRVNDLHTRRSVAALEGWIPGLTSIITGDLQEVARLATEPRWDPASCYGRTELEADISRLDVTDTMRVYHRGALIDVEGFLQRPHILHRPGVVNTSSVLSALGAGYTFNFGTIDRWNRPLNLLAEHLERVIGGPSEVYAFLSGGSTAASPLHFDQPDPLAVPIEGPKWWDVRRSRHTFAMGPDHVDGGEPDVAFAGVLHPREALVVPRAWLHKAAPCDHLSICLTFGLFRTFAARLGVEVVNALHEVEELRRPWSTGWDGEADSVDHMIRSISPRLHDRISAESLLSVAARGLAELPVRNDGPMSWGLAVSGEVPIDTRVRAHVPGGFLPIESGPGVVSCAGGNRLIEAPDGLAGALELVLCSDGWSLAELADGSAQPDEVLEVAAGLLAAGLLDNVSVG